MPYCLCSSAVAGPPTLTGVEALSDTTISVRWSPLDGEEGVIAYEISFTPSTVDCPELEGGSQTVSGGVTAEIVLTGLEEYTQYNITIRAENSIGCGPPSDFMVARTAASGM